MTTDRLTDDAELAPAASPTAHLLDELAALRPPAERR